MGPRVRTGGCWAAVAGTVGWTGVEAVALAWMLCTHPPSTPLRDDNPASFYYLLTK